MLDFIIFVLVVIVAATSLLYIAILYAVHIKEIFKQELPEFMKRYREPLRRPLYGTKVMQNKKDTNRPLGS